MVTLFELHLQGMDVPEGLIDADRLVDIVGSLQEMATRVGRIETDSSARGRPNRALDRVVSLRIGLTGGTTTIVAERSLSLDVFDLELADEVAADRRFAELLEGIGLDQRPAWVPDSLASAAEGLVDALKRTAPRVEVRVDGVNAGSFETRSIRRETWQVSAPAQITDEVTFTGRLFAVNLNTHRLQVQDDVGNRVALPDVSNDVEVGSLIGGYVNVTGLPVRDADGSLTHITQAAVHVAPDPLGGRPMSSRTSFEELLSSAPGPTPGGFIHMTDDEFAAFMEAARG